MGRLATLMRLEKLLSDGLMARTVRGSAVVASVQMAQNVLRLASNLVLVRLVAPEAFGLFGVALAINQAVVMFSDVGIPQSVIRSPNGDRRAFYSTAFTANFSLNILLYVLIGLLSITVGLNQGLMPEGTILQSEQAPALIAVAGLQVLGLGLVSPNLWIAKRKLLIGKVASIQFVAQIIGTLVTLGAAAVGWGVWSLVFGMIAAQISNILASHVVLSGAPAAFKFHRRCFVEIFHFGKWLVPASIGGFLIKQSDKILLGFWMAATNFSVFIIGATWYAAAFGVSLQVLQQIAFPAISEALRSGREEAIRFYRQYRLIVDLLCLAIFLAFNIGVTLVIKFMYPPEYIGAIEFARILSLGILCLPYELVSSVVLSSGDSRGFSFISIASAPVVIAAAFVLNALCGPTAAIYAFALGALPQVPVMLRLASHHIPFQPMTELRQLLFLAAGVMGIIFLTT
jgi:O-antigen/teichoic acid export membrane protein